MGLSQEDVSAGLMSAKALSRFENDENYPNSYMMQILFERVGKSLRHFILCCLSLNMNIICGVGTRLLKFFGEILYIMLFIKDIKVNISMKKLQLADFVLFGKAFLDNNLEQMQNAIVCTVKNYPNQLTMRNCLSMEEISYILLYVEKKLTVRPDKWQEEYAQIRFLLNYVERMFDSEEIVEIYGRAVYDFWNIYGYTGY